MNGSRFIASMLSISMLGLSGCATITRGTTEVLVITPIPPARRSSLRMGTQGMHARRRAASRLSASTATT
jgi:hypothetical protein